MLMTLHTLCSGNEGVTFSLFLFLLLPAVYGFFIPAAFVYCFGRDF